jgi:hypothetical protein
MSQIDPKICLKLTPDEVLIQIMNYDELIQELTTWNSALDSSCREYRYNVQRIKNIEAAKKRLLMPDPSKTEEKSHSNSDENNRQMHSNLDENNV